MTTVYVASNQGTKGVYHSDKDCSRLKDKRREWCKKDAEKMDYKKCEICEHGEWKEVTDRDKSLRRKINDGEISL